MRQALIVSGVLGGGTALVFAAAAVMASLFPTGTMIPAGWNGAWGGGWEKGGIAVPMPAPLVVPADGGRLDAIGGAIVVQEPSAVETPPGDVPADEPGPEGPLPTD
jgi:hypothetical protein